VSGKVCGCQAVKAICPGSEQKQSSQCATDVAAIEELDKGVVFILTMYPSVPEAMLSTDNGGFAANHSVYDTSLIMSATQISL